MMNKRKKGEGKANEGKFCFIQTQIRLVAFSYSGHACLHNF